MKKTILSMIAAGTLLIVTVTLTGMTPDSEEPARIDPGPIGGPPSDAIVLFDGKDLSMWRGNQAGSEAKWDVKDGTMITNRTGNVFTKQEFGDVQLHVEWAAPTEIKGTGQGRGNSGVYLQGRYEIQVLDSSDPTNPTYFNGQAGAFYGKSAPLVNPCRKPGEWQTYDIIFHAPKTGDDGKVTPGSFTVLFNGVLVQDNVPIQGGATTAAAFKGVTPKGPLMLQDHGNPVKYRNIWVRPLN